MLPASGAPPVRARAVISDHGGVSSTEQPPDDVVEERLRVQREAQQHADERRRERRSTSVASMVISLGVVLGIVLVLLLVVPRQNSVTQPPVDVAAGARVAASQVDFTPSLPTALPATWRPTSVRTTVATAQVLTWHAGWVIDGKRYAALEQGKNAPQEWLAAQTNRGRPDGTQDVDGVAWQRILRLDKVQNSLVHTRDGVTTIVTGTAPYDELAVLAAALRPAG